MNDYYYYKATALEAESFENLEVFKELSDQKSRSASVLSRTYWLKSFGRY